MWRDREPAYRRRRDGVQLTARQAQVLNAVSSYLLEHGTVPTLRELAELTGIGTVAGVTHHLEALHRKGYIFVDGTRKARSMRIVRSAEGELVRLAFVPLIPKESPALTGYGIPVSF